MGTLLQQLPALIGVVIGAFGSFIVAHATERGRFRREQSARWDDKRMSAYAEYARALKQSIIVAERIAAHLGNDPRPQPLVPEEGFLAFAAAIPEREAAWESVLLLGTSEAIEAAQEWQRLVWQMEHFARDQVRNPEQWQTLWRDNLARRA